MLNTNTQTSVIDTDVEFPQESSDDNNSGQELKIKYVSKNCSSL